MFSVIENSVNLEAVKFDAFYLVKLISGKYFRYFDVNRVAYLMQLHLQLGAICVLVRERVDVETPLHTRLPQYGIDYQLRL